MNNSRLHCLAAISLVALIAFAVRSASLDGQSLWRDEVDALCYAFEFPQLIVQTLAPQAAGDPSTPFACPPPPATLGEPSDRGLSRLMQTVGEMIRQNGPLYFFLLRGWSAVTGTSAYAMRFFSLMFGVLCVPLVYALGRRLFDRQTGVLAALLVTASPYLVWYSQEVKMYTLVPAMALVAIYGLRRAIEGEGWQWWGVQIVATSLAFYAHILAALLIPVQVLLYFVWWPQARRRWVGALTSLACLTLPYLPLVVWQAQRVFQERETGFYPYTLGEMAEILLNSWGAGIVNWGWPWGAALMAALAVWGLVSPLKNSHGETFPRANDTRGKDTRNRFALVCWLATPPLIVWLISLRQPLFTDRYLIWTAPAFYLLIASGLASLRRFGNWGRWASLLLMGVILALNDGVNLWQQATAPMKADFRAATAYVADHRSSDGRIAPQALINANSAFKCYLPLVVSGYTFDELIIFQIPHGRYAFDYYFHEHEEGKEYAWAEGLYTNHRAPDGSYRMSEQEAVQHMQKMTAGYSVIWLVATEVTMWDERGLVQAWLEESARRVDEARFKYIDVYRYVK